VASWGLQSRGEPGAFCGPAVYPAEGGVEGLVRVVEARVVGMNLSHTDLEYRGPLSPSGLEGSCTPAEHAPGVQARLRAPGFSPRGGRELAEVGKAYWQKVVGGLVHVPDLTLRARPASKRPRAGRAALAEHAHLPPAHATRRPPRYSPSQAHSVTQRGGWEEKRCCDSKPCRRGMQASFGGVEGERGVEGTDEGVWVEGVGGALGALGGNPRRCSSPWALFPVSAPVSAELRTVGGRARTTSRRPARCLGSEPGHGTKWSGGTVRRSTVQHTTLQYNTVQLLSVTLSLCPCVTL